MRYFLLVVTIALMPGWLKAAELQQELDEVVVTASRVSEKIKDTAVAVNVLPEAELEKVKARNPTEFRWNPLDSTANAPRNTTLLATLLPSIL